MKKVLVVVVAAFLVAVFAGCSGGSSSASESANQGSTTGKEISGSPTSVVEQCQEVTAGEDVTVTVVGKAIKGPKGDTFYTVRDDKEGVSSLVQVLLKDSSEGEKISGRTTFRGKLDTKSIASNNITLTDVEVVE